MPIEHSDELVAKCLPIAEDGQITLIVDGQIFGSEGDSPVIDALLCGAPRILFNVASIPSQ